MNLKKINANFVMDLDYVEDEADSQNVDLERRPNESERQFLKRKSLKLNFLNPKLHYIHFDSNTLKIDRVVSCSEMFDIIHPKKASKIMSKWSDSIVRIIQTLINFKYENVSRYR